MSRRKRCNYCESIEIFMRVRIAKVREAWAEFLCRYEWDVFATLTYAGSVWTSEKIMRNFQTWLFEWQVRTAIERSLASATWSIQRDGYGRQLTERRKLSGTWWNRYRAGRAFPVWVVGVEPHESGKLHAHALIRWSSALPDLTRTEGWHLWSQPKELGGLGFGWSRIEAPTCQDDVNAYVSKYVVKGGELFLSPSFDAAKLDAVEDQRPSPVGR